MKDRKYILRRVLLSILILLPVLGWIMPSDFFDKEGLILCPSKLFFDIECFGCGMTRAVMHFHHLELGAAIYYNALVIIIYPLLLFIWGQMLWKLVIKILNEKRAMT